MRLLLSPQLLLAIICLSLIPGPLLAHGGTYRGPRTPPILGRPTGPPGGTTGAGRRRSTTPSLDVRLWENWWAFNRDDFFPIRGVSSVKQGSSDAAYDPLGGGPPNARDVREHIIPVLLAALQDRDHEVRNSAAVALGRVGSEPELAPLLAALKDRERSVVEGAIVGLGLLRVEAAEARLTHIVKDSSRPARQRGFAMLALGFSGGARARSFLQEKLGAPHAGRRSRSAHLASLQILAAGLVFGSDLPGAPSTRADPMTGHILQAMRTFRVKERLFLPSAFVALSKTRSEAAQSQVMKGLKDRRAEVRAAAAIALGRVFKHASPRTVRRWGHLLGSEKDHFARRLLMISLGRVGGPGEKALLVRELGARSEQDQAFAALALAIAGAEELAPAFRRSFRTSRGISLKGAYGLALGLLHDAASATLMAKSLKQNKSPELRAHLVQALMLLGDQSQAAIMEKLLAKTRIASLQAATALSLGLLGAPSSEKILLTLLASSGTITVKGAAATGLGRRGDRRLIAPLAAFVRDKSEQDLSRAFGCIALGLLGEKTPTLSPFARLAIDSQYNLRDAVLDEFRDLL